MGSHGRKNMECEREKSIKIATYSTSSSKRMDLPSTWMEKIKSRFKD